MRWGAGIFALASTVTVAGCKSESDPGPAADETSTTSVPATETTTTSTGGETTAETGADASSSGETGTVDEPWAPGTVFPSPTEPNPRGLLDVRGIVHAHSVYSHDACDGEPLDAQGMIDAVCYEDLRRGMCQTKHDFVMFTDHADSFATHEFPDVLLYDASRGDVLVERSGPVANWAGCEGGRPVLVLAGCESGTMPVGIDGHLADRGLYGEATPAAIMALKDQGAVVLVAHTEEWDVQQLVDLPLDGFEMYNLHANMEANIPAALELLSKVNMGGEGLPHPDLVVMPIWQEDARYLERWGSVLASGARRVTTLGTDSHRNTLPQELEDGERVDSFRRMKLWFSNHLLVDVSNGDDWNDLALEDALRSGRLYGAFEYMGYPEGFDARAEVGDVVVELGGEVSLADGPELVATRPSVRKLDPDVPAPEVSLHLLHAIDGGFEEVGTSTDQELRVTPEAPGAYRFEVRIVPRHLEPYLGDYVDLAETPRVWIYANPIYVAP